MLSFPARHTNLGSMEIRRALPIRERRMVGAWCFLDRYGPVTFANMKPMDVAPHPHIGLQTVSWLLDGEVLHRDSLGSESLIRPGELNLMTSARGIAHSEETPLRNSGRINGVQLWVALPNAARNDPPAFAHHAELPRCEFTGGHATIFLGSLGETHSPAAAYSPIVGAELVLGANSEVTLPLDRTFEHALFVTAGEAGELRPDVLYFLPAGLDDYTLRSRDGARLLLLGGRPFEEPIVMWWNFVARTHEEIVAARDAWMGRDGRFGDVRGYDGPTVDAPPIHARAHPPAAS